MLFPPLLVFELMNAECLTGIWMGGYNTTHGASLTLSLNSYLLELPHLSMISEGTYLENRYVFFLLGLF